MSQPPLPNKNRLLPPGSEVTDGCPWPGPRSKQAGGHLCSLGGVFLVVPPPHLGHESPHVALGDERHGTTPPSGPREAGPEGPGPHAQPHQPVKLGTAALVQLTAAPMALVHQPAQLHGNRGRVPGPIKGVGRLLEGKDPGRLPKDVGGPRTQAEGLHVPGHGVQGPRLELLFRHLQDPEQLFPRVRLLVEVLLDHAHHGLQRAPQPLLEGPQGADLPPVHPATATTTRPRSRLFGDHLGREATLGHALVEGREGRLVGLYQGVGDDELGPRGEADVGGADRVELDHLGPSRLG